MVGKLILQPGFLSQASVPGTKRQRDIFFNMQGSPTPSFTASNRTKVDYSNRGADAALYASRETGKEDYKDDYMGRPKWVNYLMDDPNGPTKAPHVKRNGRTDGPFPWFSYRCRHNQR